MNEVTQLSDFIIVGVYPVVLKGQLRYFKYKVIFPDRTSKWVVREDYMNFDSQPMIREVSRAIEINIQSYGAPQI